MRPGASQRVLATVGGYATAVVALGGLCGGALRAEGAEAIPVPSGQMVTLLETVQNAPGSNGLAVRFRFLAPAISRDGGAVTPEVAFEDMAFLCENYALPRLPSTGPVPAQIIISLADRDVPFGEPNPEATQFFEAYHPENGLCIWESF